MLMCLSQRRPRQPQPVLRLLLALPIMVLLLSSYTSATPAAVSSADAESPILTPVPLAVLNTSVLQQRPLRLVLAGPSGAGKTLFCEFLRFAIRTSDMADPAQASAEFLRSYHLLQGTEESFLSDTQKVTKYTETLNGGGSVEIYDTPGLLDTAGSDRDFEHLVEIAKQLESLDYVDAVLFVFHGGQQSRFHDRMKKVVAQLSAVFQPAVYPNIALLFSHLSRPCRSPQMMIDPYLKADFGFTSEEVKSRRFFLNNPFDALAQMFRPYAQGETIASVLQRGQSLNRKRYNNGVKELNRLLQYVATNVSRCTNLNFGTASLRKLVEIAVQLNSNLRSELKEERKTRAEAERQITELQAEVRQQVEEGRTNRAKAERHITELQAEVRRQAEEERKNRAKAERQVTELRAEDERKNRAKAEMQVMDLQGAPKVCEGALDAQESKEAPANSASASETNIFAVLAIASAVLLLISILYIVRRRSSILSSIASNGSRTLPL